MVNKMEGKCYLSVGIAIGTALGAAFGLVFENIGLVICIGLGLMFGASIGGLVNDCKVDIKENVVRVFSVGVIIVSITAFVLLFPKITALFL